MIKIKKVTYQPADIYAMNAVPQLVLQAPAAGKGRTILGITHDMEFETAAYTGAALLLYGTDPANWQTFVDTKTLAAVGNINQPALRTSVQDLSGFSGELRHSASPFTTVKDFYVTTDGLAATGDSPIDVYIAYEDRDISES